MDTLRNYIILDNYIPCSTKMAPKTSHSPNYGLTSSSPHTTVRPPVPLKVLRNTRLTPSCSHSILYPLFIFFSQCLCGQSPSYLLSLPHCPCLFPEAFPGPLYIDNSTSLLELSSGQALVSTTHHPLRHVFVSLSP